MNNNISYRISRIPRQEKYIASFKRGWRSQWTHYRQAGTFRDFESWDSAWQFLLARCHGNVAFLNLHLCGVDPLPNPADNVEVHVQPDNDLFGALCDAYERVKDSLDSQARFYYLRGALSQWCVDHKESIFEMESLFMDDIHFLARQAQW